MIIWQRVSILTNYFLKNRLSHRMPVCLSVCLSSCLCLWSRISVNTFELAGHYRLFTFTSRNASLPITIGVNDLNGCRRIWDELRWSAKIIGSPQSTFWGSTLKIYHHVPAPAKTDRNPKRQTDLHHVPRISRLAICRCGKHWICDACDSHGIGLNGVQVFPLAEKGRIRLFMCQ